MSVYSVKLSGEYSRGMIIVTHNSSNEAWDLVNEFLIQSSYKLETISINELPGVISAGIPRILAQMIYIE